MSAAAVFFLCSASVALGSLSFRITHPRMGEPPPGRAPHAEAATKHSAKPPRPAPLSPSQKEDKPHLQSIGYVPEASGVLRSAEAVAPQALALNALGRPTHSPGALFARAGKLVNAGVNLILTETTIAERSIEEIEREIGPSARILPIQGGHGIRISTLSEGSIAWAAGLEQGDLLTAVNGYALSSPDAMVAAYESVRQNKLAVLELQRGQRSIVLKVGFSR